MGEKHLTPKTEEKIREITDHLERLDRYSKFLYTLAGYQDELEKDSINMSLDTLEAFAGAMSLTVETLSAELGLLEYKGRPTAEVYILKPQAGQGGAA